MRVSARLLQRIRFYAVMLLVTALGVRGAVPSGYMLDEAQDGRGLVIRMCGSGGNHEVYLDLTRGEYRDVKDAAAPKDPPRRKTRLLPRRMTTRTPPAPSP